MGTFAPVVPMGTAFIDDLARRYYTHGPWLHWFIVSKLRHWATFISDARKCCAAAVDAAPSRDPRRADCCWLSGMRTLSTTSTPTVLPDLRPKFGLCPARMSSTIT